METIIVSNDTFCALKFNEALLDEINEAELSSILGRYPYGLEVLSNYKFLAEGLVEITIIAHKDWDLKYTIFGDIELRLKWLKLRETAIFAIYDPERGYLQEQTVEIKINIAKLEYFKTKEGSIFYIKRFSPA